MKSTRSTIVLALLAVAGLGPRVSPAATQASDPEEIIFAVRQPGKGGHWYENFGYLAIDPGQKLYGSQGRLCRLNLRTGKLTVLVDDPEGAVRDPQLHYDARKILFSYRPAGTDFFHLYEVNIDGSGLRRLTDGEFDDLEPTYLADGRIMFCSSRCQRFVPCWFSHVAILYACDADGSNLHPVSANIEQDNTPWPLPDGRVIYERWEYVDRSRVSFHHLWTFNPDGTGQMVYYGNLHPGTLMIDAKPIPGTDKVVAIFSPKHGKKEHTGAVTVITPKSGPDDLGSARRISQGEDYRDPYPLSEDRFLVAQGPAILMMDGQGETREIYRLPRDLVKAGAECQEPRPLAARPREHIIPPRVDLAETTGRLVMNDIYAGRRMQGVERGEIKKLLVLETLPKPTNDSGKMPPMSFGGTYTLERILGTVPVEPDGSAYFEVPAMRSLFFVALDKQNNSVKRMQSFLSLMPGETGGCVGCHEQRTKTPFRPDEPLVQATRRPPSPIEPLQDIPEIFDYPRDIQPILDRHCVECHDYPKREGSVILSGDRGPVYSHSYFTLTAWKQVADGRDAVETNLPPRAIGTSASPLMQKINGSHYDVMLSPHEQDMIRYWIESAAVYPGTYAALGSGMIGGYPKSQLDKSEQEWPVSIAAGEAIRRRCAGCHDKSLPLPEHLSDDMGLILSNPDPDDPRIRYSRHLMFNLTRPQESLILLGPLAADAGGYGLCHERTQEGQPAKRLPQRSPRPPAPEAQGVRAASSPLPLAGEGQGVRAVTVFATTSDPDYQKILALCLEGKRYLDQIKRFDMPGFRPTEQYVRELQRFGILPQDLRPGDPIDFYATDRAYWESLWWKGGRGAK